MDFNEKRIFGMIHLSGDETNKIERAIEEITIYEEEGLYGCIIENYHGSVDDVESVLRAIKDRNNKIKLGINILPNEYRKALELATNYKADFIQLDYISGRYNTGIELNDDDYIRCCNEHSNIKVFGGVWPKYYTPINGSDLKGDIEIGLFLCDGIVVTGSGTGKETPLDKIKLFREHMNHSDKYPLIIGAGLDSNNVGEQLLYAEGAIVGSCFKPYKRTQEKVNRELVKEFMNEVNKII